MAGTSPAMTTRKILNRRFTALALMDIPMPASQHQSPKSDIEISQTATKRRILDIAKEKLGIAPENLEP